MRATFAAVAAVAAVVVSSAPLLRAQEAAPARPAEQADDEDSSRAQARPHLQVLQHPYEIASFYRSSQSSGFDLGYDAPETGGKYPIAGFYRAGARGAYSAFWTTGYGTRGMRGRGFLGRPRVRPMGLNGDLFLFAPFLAPVGPLNGVFLDR